MMRGVVTRLINAGPSNDAHQRNSPVSLFRRRKLDAELRQHFLIVGAEAGRRLVQASGCLGEFDGTGGERDVRIVTPWRTGFEHLARDHMGVRVDILHVLNRADLYASVQFFHDLLTGVV